MPWHVDAVARLFIDEKLTPADLLSQQTTEIHQLIRDLYLLACAGALGGALNHNSNTTLLAQYARTLRGLMQTRH